MSAQTDENRSNAYKAYQILKRAIDMQGALYIQTGRTLKEIRDGRLYAFLGEGGYDSFRQFINDPEIAMRYSTAYLYIRVFEYYIERLQLTESDVIKIPLNRLMRLLPILKAKPDDEAIKIIDDINNTTNFDYDTIISERKLETDRPVFLRDKDTGRYVLRFYEHQIKQIVNLDSGDILFERQ